MILRCDKKTILNIAFTLFFSTQFLFPYSVVSRVFLLLFCVATLIIPCRIVLKPYFIAYSLFVLWSLLNILCGKAINATVAVEMIKTLILNLVFLFAFARFCEIQNDPVSFFKMYRNIAVALAAYFIMVGLITNAGAGGRLSATGLNSNGIGKMYGFSLIIHLYLILEKKDKIYFIGQNILIISLCTAVILLSGSRTALLIPIIGWGILFCCRNPRRIPIYILLGACSLGILVFLLLNVDFFYSLIGYRVAPLLQYLQGASYEEASLSTRNSYILLAWEYSKHNPIWGYGLDCFRTLRHAYGTYSHSNYMEILFSTGWVGLIIYYCVPFATLLRTGAAFKQNKSVMALLLSTLIPFLAVDIMTITYFSRDALVIVYAAVTYLGKLTKNENYKTNKKSLQDL